MKFITHFHQTLTGANARVMALNRGFEGGGEQENSISQILAQPLQFSLADLNQLEKAITQANGKLTGAEQNQFQQLVNLHLARIKNENASSQPSRLLFALFRNSKLSQFLTSHQRKAIETKLSQESKTLEKFASKDVKDWTETDAISLARSYRFVRSRLNTVNLAIDSTRLDAGDKLKIYTRNLAQKTGAMTPKEKLFLIEMARIFPNASDWSNYNADTFTLVKTKARSFKQDFENTMSSPEGRVQAEAKFYWDTLVPENDETPNPKVLEFLQRSAAVESLQALSDKTERVKAGEVSSKPLVLSQLEWKFLRTLSTEPQTIFEFEGGAAQTLMSTENKLTTAQANQQNLERALSSQKQALEAKSPAVLKDEAGLPVAQKEKFDDRWLSSTQIDNTPVAEGQTPNPQQEQWALFKKWQEASIALILEEKRQGVEAAKAASSNAKAELDRAQEKIEDEQKDLLSYKNPAEQAQILLAQHKVQFKSRLAHGRLVAGDFNFLRYLPPEQQSDYLGPAGDQVLNLINDTRQALTQTIQNDLGINLLGEVSESDLAALDKFLSYEAIIKQLAETKLAGNSSELLTVYENIKGRKLFDPAQVLAAVSSQIREEVLQRINQPSVRESGAYNQFLHHYTRQHHNLEKSDRVEKLLAFSHIIEKEKKEKIDNVYEHAYEKVSALFASAEEPQILEDLNKILKTEIQAHTVLDRIRSYLPEGGFIHNESAGTLKNLQQKIVGELGGKVTPANDNPIHLALVAQSLLTKLDQLQAAENAKLALQHGASQLEAKDEETLTVSSRLDLAERTKLVHLEVEDLNESFQRDLEQIKTTLDRGEEAKFLVGDFLKEFDQSYRPRLDFLKGALVAECDLYFEEKTDFSRKLEEKISSHINILASGVDGLKILYKSGNIAAGDKGYTALQQAMLMSVLPLFDLQGGSAAKDEKNKIDGTLTHAAETHKFIRDDLGLLEGEGREKAQENYAKQLQKYDKLVTDFKSSWTEAKQRLEKDLKRFTEEEFVQKYNLGKSQMREIMKNNNQNLKDADTLINYYSGGKKSFYEGPKADVFSKWLNDYENPEKQPQALKFMNTFRDLDNILGPDQEDFAGQTAGFDKFIRDHKNSKGTLWFKKRYKITVKWYSLTSVWQMVKKSYEAWGKKTERERDKMTAELGARIWGDTLIGREFSSEANTKEEERVNHFKKSFEDKSVSYLYNRLNRVKDIKNKDEAKAAISLLIDKGALRWDSLDLLELLSRLQDGVVFNLPQDIDSYIESPALLKSKIGQAIASIWDRPTWEQWQSDLPSKYESRMKTFENEYTEQIQKGGVKAYLESMLEKWEKGIDDPNIEITKYEKFIQMAFDRGEMNGYPGGDARWFFLVKGLTTKNPKGETILGPDSITRFTSLVGKVPYLDALDDKSSWKKNGKIVPPGTTGGHKGSWTVKDIQAWGGYFSGISPQEAGTPKMMGAVRLFLNDCLVPAEDSQDRMGKVTISSIDRDDAGILPLLVSSERLMDGILRYASGDKRPVDDKYYVNLLTSFNQNFEDSVKFMKTMLAENKDAEGYKDYSEKQLRRFGEIMRTYFMISQVLAGNWDTEGSVGAVTLSDAEWTNNRGPEIYDNITDKIAQFLGGEEGAKVEKLKNKRYRKQKSNEAKKKLEEKKNKGEALSAEEQAQVDTWNNVQNIYKNNPFADTNLVIDFLNRDEI